MFKVGDKVILKDLTTNIKYIRIIKFANGDNIFDCKYYCGQYYFNEDFKHWDDTNPSAIIIKLSKLEELFYA